jgi:hypothetical protein
MKSIVKWTKWFMFGAVALTALWMPSIVKAQENGPVTPNNQAQPSAPMNANNRVAIVGAVANPGTFLYEGGMMLKDAFAAVGGFTKDADRDRIVVTRGMLIDPSKAQKISYDYDKVMKGKAADVPLMPGDVVEVTEHRGKRNLLGQITSGLKRLPSALVSTATGSPLTVPLLSKAAQGLGSLIGIGDKNKPANVMTPGFAGSALTGGGDASNPNRPPTPLESALIQAVAAESPEVRERILQRVIAALQAQGK